MAITPDTKDWTWVLHAPCPECGLDTRTIARDDIPAMLRANAVAWAAMLATDPSRARPEPSRWSPLEYACHVRDVFVRFDERLELMLSQDDPFFPNWDQDATAVEQRYQEQDPALVRVELSTAAERLAGRIEQVAGAQWLRPGRRSDGASFTVESFVRYLLHDPLHHLVDVTGRRLA